MAKLKVGDIEMDSAGGISFAQVNTSSRHASLTPHVPRADAPSTSQSKTQDVVWIASSALAIITSVLLLGAVLFTSLPTSALLFAAPLIGIPAIALMRRARATSPPKRGASRDHTGELRKERAARIKALFEGESRTLDVAQLVARTGWTEAAVLEGLVTLLEDEVLEEDVDLDGQCFVYRPSSRFFFDFDEHDSALQSAAERYEHAKHASS